jgi:hypothetical protein
MQILWWEALALFAVYIGYALFMKYNSTIEIVVKKRFGWKIEEEEGEEAEGEEEEGRPLEEAQTAVTEWRKTTKNGGGKGPQQQQQQQVGTFRRVEPVTFEGRKKITCHC